MQIVEMSPRAVALMVAPIVGLVVKSGSRAMMVSAIPEETRGYLSYWSSMRRRTSSSLVASSMLVVRVSGKEAGIEGTATSSTVVCSGDEGTSGVCAGDRHEFCDKVERDEAGI